MDNEVVERLALLVQQRSPKGASLMAIMKTSCVVVASEVSSFWTIEPADGILLLCEVYHKARELKADS